MITIGLQSGLADQTSELAIGSETMTLRVKWNQRFNFWSLSLYDRESSIIIGGIRMVRDAPLLQNLRVPNIDGEFIFIRQFGDKAEADFNSLGNDFVLVYITREEINAVIS
ncbi:hypothetical protein SAMN05216522_10519 [Rosenbergiella nectarea]|uniref:Cyanophage baseplate Pam3 plug gp18 domain-containing protein n=1 Tax=Rosenbergiella nectarea TaxID=988801 RepID=A0A1H9HQT7_9GAMM|nr:hypothetical protein [Rosenbergiella nectarea]SEQ64648.1 hypothetical protein SAMN05216522_10519 [Rosenbergiella nectarea]